MVVLNKEVEDKMKELRTEAEYDKETGKPCLVCLKKLRERYFKIKLSEKEVGCVCAEDCEDVIRRIYDKLKGMEQDGEKVCFRCKKPFKNKKEMFGSDIETPNKVSYYHRTCFNKSVSKK